MLRHISRLLALSTLSFGVAGSLFASPGSITTTKAIGPLAQAILAPVSDGSGDWKLIVVGPPGTSATASWNILSDVKGVVTATVGHEGGVSVVRFATAAGVLVDLELCVPGSAPKSLSKIGSAGATLTIGIPTKPAKYRTGAGGILASTGATSASKP